VPASEIDRFFDADGNQTVADGLPSLAWDYADRLAGATVALSGGGTQTATLAHDVLNTPMREVVSSAGAETVDTLRLDALQITRTTPPGGGAPAVAYRMRVRNPRALVAEALTDPEASEPVIAYVLSDLAGSVTVRLDRTGALLSYESYTPYGATAFAVMPAAAEAQDKLDRFGQHARARATGLYDYGARSLAPWLGRWLSPDPTGPVDGLNLFAFVTDNPTSFIDVGGRVKIQLSDGTEVEVTPEEL
jgi:RHS repeat-associated protein